MKRAETKDEQISSQSTSPAELSPEDRAAYLKYVTPSTATPQQLRALAEYWTDERIQMAQALGL